MSRALYNIVRDGSRLWLTGLKAPANQSLLKECARSPKLRCITGRTVGKARLVQFYVGVGGLFGDQSHRVCFSDWG